MYSSDSLQLSPWQVKHHRAITIAWTACLALAISPEARAQPTKPAVEAKSSPWGISSSSSSFKNYNDWFPMMSAAGVSTVRLFPEWRSLEPTPGKWQWDQTDAFVKAAADNKIEINAILMGSTPWTKAKSHAFPMDNLEDWSRYVATVVERYKNRIRYWEVWNEGNGGFNDDRHTTVDYAKLAAATYAAAKKADPKAQIGLSVASFDAPYLNQAIRALAKAEKPNSFDFLCIHPYEIADGLRDADGEIPYLWMTRGLRDMLKASAPTEPMSRSGSRKSAGESRIRRDRSPRNRMRRRHS